MVPYHNGNSELLTNSDTPWHTIIDVPLRKKKYKLLDRIVRRLFQLAKYFCQINLN